MIFCLVRKYFALVLVLAVALAALPLLSGEVPASEALPQAVCWSGFIAAAVVYFEFRRRHLWPLYDNLQLPKQWLLGLLVAANLFLFAIPKAGLR